MKKLKTKLFISLGLVATAVTACFVAAYTINIGNQESYGTLNLNKLILRNSGGGTGIVLDGTEYVIKIGENAGSDEYSKLRVAYICERNGQHCKTIAQLAQDNDSSNVLKILGSGTPAVSFNQKEDATLNIVGSGATNVSATDGKITISSTDNDTRNANTLNVSGYVAAPTGGTSKKVRKTNNSGYPSRQDDADTHYQGVLTIQGSGTEAVQFDQENSPTLNIVGSGNTAVSATTNTITIYSTGGGGGDSHWEDATAEENSPIKPKNNKNITFSQTNASITHNGSLTINKNGVNQAAAISTFDSNGLRVGNGSYTGVGVGILNKIVIGGMGCSSDRISIYATGSNGESNFEILGNQRLLVGTQGNGYIYFNNNSYGRVGINTNTSNNMTAALTVNGGIRIGNNCESNTCNQFNVGRIIYYESGDKGYFVGCKRIATGNMSSSFKRQTLNGNNIDSSNVPSDTLNCHLSIPYEEEEYSSVFPSSCS